MIYSMETKHQTVSMIELAINFYVFNEYKR